MPEADRTRLRRFARRMAGLSFVLACLVPPLILLTVIRALEGGGAPDVLNGVAVETDGIPFLAKAGIYALNIGLALVLARALWRLQETFRHLGGETPDLADAACSMAAAGRWFLGGALLGVAVRTGSILLATLHLPEGQTLVSIGVGPSEFFGILVAGTLLVLGEALAMASAIDAENRTFV